MSNSTARRPTVYESAIDWWLAMLLVATPVLAAILGVYLMWTGRAGDATWLFVVGALAALITAAFAVPCRYTILEDTLSIRCGLLVYQVPLSEIEHVEKSSSMWSGAALSLRRVLVKSGRRKHLISPKDRDDFIRDLRKAVKQAKQ